MTQAEILLDLYAEIFYGCVFRRLEPWNKKRVVNGALAHIDNSITIVESLTGNPSIEYKAVKEELLSVNIGNQEIGRTN